VSGPDGCPEFSEALRKYRRAVVGRAEVVDDALNISEPTMTGSDGSNERLKEPSTFATGSGLFTEETCTVSAAGEGLTGEL